MEQALSECDARSDALGILRRNSLMNSPRIGIPLFENMRLELCGLLFVRTFSSEDCRRTARNRCQLLTFRGLGSSSTLRFYLGYPLQRPFSIRTLFSSHFAMQRFNFGSPPIRPISTRTYASHRMIATGNDSQISPHHSMISRPAREQHCAHVSILTVSYSTAPLSFLCEF